VSAFFFAKVFVDMIPVRIVPLIGFSIITYFMIGKTSLKMKLHICKVKYVEVFCKW